MPAEFVPETPTQAARHKKEELAAVRFQFETGGINSNGAIIKTDRESQAQLTGAYIALKFGLRQSVDWKSENGWVVLGISELEPVAHAVAAHVQNSFTQERIHGAAIDAMVADGKTVDEIMAYDITFGFKG